MRTRSDHCTLRWSVRGISSEEDRLRAAPINVGFHAMKKEEGEPLCRASPSDRPE